METNQKINVLVLGTPGSGKTTLIQSVLGFDREDEESKDITQIERSRIYENDSLPFRMIDTDGIDFERLRKTHLKRMLRRQARNSVQTGTEADNIHVIWFCMDTHSRRIILQTLDYLGEISAIWKDIPILLVMTKSYSENEMVRNQAMFEEVLDDYPKRDELNLRAILPVVARPYEMTIEERIISPYGLEELVARTCDLIPDAEKLNDQTVKSIKLEIKKSMARGVVASFTAAATAVGAAPTSFSDSLLLVPIQSTMLYSVARIYKIGNNAKEKEIVNAIIKVGLTTWVGHTLVQAAKSIPGINIAAAVLDAIVAGTVTFIAGEISIAVFDKVKRGELNLDNVDWTDYITGMFKKMLPQYGKVLENALNSSDANGVLKNLAKILRKLA